MNLSGGSATGIAGAVWVNATRSLTNTGPMISLIQVSQTTIPASGTVNLRPIAGKIREITIGAKSGAAGAVNIQLTDGSNQIGVVTGASGANSVTFFVQGSLAVGPQIFNGDATNPAFYMAVGMDWTL